MERFVALLESESCANLLLALAHTLWQGTLAAGVLFLYLRRAPAEAADRRYAASTVALGAVVLGALLTWSIFGYEPTPAPDDLPATEIAMNTPVISEPASPPPASPTLQVRPIPPTPRSRQIWIMGAWLAGVGVMLLRMVAMVVGGNRLRGQCRPLENGQVLDLVEQLRSTMRIGHRIRVLVGERLSTPGVIGCFWPALLLPASMVSGIPADDLRAILVHELAHIRRYDYLVNFVQMVVEALLFFNPAVWWISRQIRIEREACCDAAGVQWTGQCTRYAEALVAWAHHLGTPAPTVGFARDTDPNTLLDRIRRILIAGHQPRPRIPWHIATAMLGLSLACLALIGQATGLAVDLAGRILTAQERVEKIAAVSTDYGYASREYGPEDKINVSGVVRTWDSTPLPKRSTVMLDYIGHNSHRTGPVEVSDDGTFRHDIDYCNRFHLIASAPGYAATFAGPFEAERGGRIEGITLVLGEGFPGRIQVVDEAGQPVPGAKLSGGYAYPNRISYHHAINLTTDANGLATFNHAAAEAIRLEIDASGFELEQIESLVLDPEKAALLPLQRALSTTGVVVAEATGQLIPGAMIRVVKSVQGRSSHGDNSPNGRVNAWTDGEGRFELKRLHQGPKHLLFVRAPGYGYRYVPDIRAGDRDIKVTLGVAKVIRGTITGDLSLLTAAEESGQPILQVKNTYEYPRSSSYSNSSGKAPVTIRDGVGHFEINDFWGQTVTLTAGPQRVRLNVDKDRLDGIVIKLRPEAKRLLVLRFQTPPDAPPVTGTVQIDYMTANARRLKEGVTSQRLEIQDSQASCEMPVPAQFTYGIDFLHGKRPVGYWFNPLILPLYITPGEGPFVLDVPTYPAGAIYGRILRADGRLATTARASLITVRKPESEGEGGQTPFFWAAAGALSEGVDRGTFNATPLPLGGQYAVAAHEGNALVASDVFLLDEKNPIINVDLALPRGIDLHGHLFEVDGTPATGSVTLVLSLKRGKRSWGTSRETQADEAGHFVFKNVNPGPTGSCFLQAGDMPGYHPIMQEIKDVASPVVVQLEKGLHAEGVVVDDWTGWPVPGAEVYAHAGGGSLDEPAPGSEWLPAEGETDAQGRFTFNNLGTRPYELGVAGADFADPRKPVIVVGGQTQSVTVRITIPGGSDLKPREPQDRQ